MTCSSDPPTMLVPPVELILSFWSRPSPRMILDDIFFATAATAEVDDAFFFEFSDDFDNALLRRMDVLDLHRTHDFHFFLHHLDAASRHVPEELLLLLVRCTFQSRGDGLFLDALQNLANRCIVQGGDIFENEH